MEPTRHRTAEAKGLHDRPVMLRYFWKRGEVVLLLPAAATGFLTRLRRLRCSGAERWPVQPTSTPAPSPQPQMCNAQPKPPPKCATVLWGYAAYVVYAA